MLEYLNFEDRKAILELIYRAYVKEKSKNVTYGITPANVIADWENFRYKWLVDNLVKPLNIIKENSKK